MSKLLSKLRKNRKTGKAKNLIMFLFLGFFVFRFFGIAHISFAEEAQEDTISLDLKNIEVVELLRLLSLKTGKTIVPSAQVQGRITLFLNNVKFEDILDMIVVTNNFAVEKKGDIYYIMTSAEYKALFGKDYFEPRDIKTIRLSYAKPANVFNALSQLKSEVGKVIADEASGTIVLIDIPEKLKLLEDTAKELDRPLDTAVFDLNYAKPADAKTQLSAAITPGTGAVIVDERSSKAVISDLPKKMEELKHLVKELDKETRQVYVETDIVEVSLGDKFQRGIDWEKLFSYRLLDGLDFKGYFPKTLTNYQKIAVGTLSRNYYNVTLNFLETYGDLKVISQPRLAVINGAEATVMVGKKDAFITATSSQSGETLLTAESIEYVDIGTKFIVTPTINEEGFITMKIKAEVSTALEPLTTSSGSRVPIVQTSNAETTVKVKDGTMIMIAGLMKEKHNDSIEGVPLLSKLPFIGILFGNREKEIERTELIVFITPRLMRGDVALYGTEPEKLIREDIMPQDLKDKLLRPPKMAQAFTELEKPGLGRDAREEAFKQEAKKEAEAKSALEAKKLIEEAKGLLEEAKKIEETRRIEAATQSADLKAKEQSSEIEKLAKIEKEKIIEAARQKEEERKRQEQIKIISDIKQLLQESKSMLEESRKLEQARQQDYQLVMEKAKKIEEAKNLLEEIRLSLEEARKTQEQKERKASEETVKRIEETKKLLNEVKVLLEETKKQVEELKSEQAARLKEAEKNVRIRRLEEAKSYYINGLELQKGGNWLEAKLNFEKAIELDPAFAPAHNQLGIILEIQGKADEAEELYLKAISIDPDYLAPYSNLALIYEAKNNKKKAIEYWKKRLALGDPNDMWAKEAMEHLEKLQGK
ncbi:MAG: tetratricopeptide repeat protein [Candidatus Omnitrophica bacterium]|nr:tetratricopeptide repeat protein [Candidatus Omnitrophota bacterium]